MLLFVWLSKGSGIPGSWNRLVAVATGTVGMRLMCRWTGQKQSPIGPDMAVEVKRGLRPGFAA